MSRKGTHNAPVHGSLAAFMELYGKKPVTAYPKSLSLEFLKDPSFRWGDIPLFITMYDLELKILLFSKPPKNTILSAKKRTLRSIFFNIFFDNKH